MIVPPTSSTTSLIAGAPTPSDAAARAAVGKAAAAAMAFNDPRLDRAISFDLSNELEDGPRQGNIRRADGIVLRYVAMVFQHEIGRAAACAAQRLVDRIGLNDRVGQIHLGMGDQERDVQSLHAFDR